MITNVFPCQFEDAPWLAQKTRGRVVFGLLQAPLKFVLSEGNKRSRLTGRGVISLLRVDTTSILCEKTVSKEFSHLRGIKGQVTVGFGFPERCNTRHASTVSPTRNIPKVPRCYHVVGPGTSRHSFEFSSKAESLFPVSIQQREVVSELGSQSSTLVIPPAMRMGCSTSSSVHTSMSHACSHRHNLWVSRARMMMASSSWSSRL